MFHGYPKIPCQNTSKRQAIRSPMAFSLAVKGRAANSDATHSPAGQVYQRLKIVQSAQHPIEIARFLVVDLRLLRTARGEVLTASIISGRAGLLVGSPACGIVLSFECVLLRHAICLHVTTGGAGTQRERQDRQNEEISDHRRLLGPQRWHRQGQSFVTEGALPYDRPHVR